MFALHEGYEGAALAGHHPDAADLTEDIKLVPDISLLDPRLEASQVQRRDRPVFGRPENHLLIGTAQYLRSNWVVLSMEAITQLLIGQLTTLWQLVAERAILATVACSLHIERAYARLVPFVIWCHSG
eukprot:CAMPEP_0115464700 /NCGR_PEP_ID=MMETSP0271-20121206/49016_1 /TAXON_ID=71861 /ORGANISM="Scrippsiella trochoidea, Strain CCMP3099" /LENGTH=127 /DNA_ID=CAMNT_0002891609 /DNA_START=327 /DNA_END=710 /DNA_ORIENTATION=+